MPYLAFRRSLIGLWAFFLAITLSANGFFLAGSAHAITENTEAELTETQERIEKTAAAYDEATANLETIENEIADTQAKIDELQASIDEQKDTSDEATVELYKWYNNGFSFLSLVFESGSLKDFINSYEYLTRAQQARYSEIEQLSSLKHDLEDSSAHLEEMRQTAEQKKAVAADALKDAQTAREEAQKKAEEEAAAEAEAAAQAIAAAQAQEKAAENPETLTPDPNTDANTGNTNTNISDVDWSSDKATFVAQWGARIDAYLSGSPLAGQGKTFAAAAWDFGVDPRYSPAISHTESTKGLYCFKPYNAWGWGQYSWSSWEEAIYAHVGGLSRGYSYTICLADAKKYCANWEHWYNTTLNQMNLI